MPLYRLHYSLNTVGRKIHEHSDEEHETLEQAEEQAEFYAWELIADDNEPDTETIGSWVELLEEEQ